MRRRSKILIFGGIVVAAGAAVAAQVASKRDRGVDVRIETVGRQDLVANVTASGQIAPKTSVDIASDITGRIISILVEEGDLVQRGQLLLRVDPTQFEAAEARAEAALSAMRAQALQTQVNRDQAQRALDRNLELRRTDPNLVSDEQLEQAQQSYDVASALAQSSDHQVRQAWASLEEARDQLSKTTLRAPMPGKVTRMAVEEGEVALASTFSRETGLLMTISDLSIIQVNVRVDETDVVRLQMGDSADITIDAFPDTAFIGRVTKISQSAIQAAGAAGGTQGDRAVDYDVEVTLDDPPPGILPDLSATAKVITDTRDNALSIPIIALTVREHTPISTETSRRDTSLVETEGVFLVVDGAAEFRPVKVGIAGEEHFEVLSGLSLGDSIVAGPYQTIRDLQDSALVRPMNTEEGRPSRRGATQVAEAQPPPSPPAASDESGTSSSGAADPLPEPAYAVQVAAVQNQEAADELVARLRREGYTPTVTRDADDLFKVRVPGFDSHAQTEDLAEELRSKIGGEPFVVDNP